MASPGWGADWGVQPQMATGTTWRKDGDPGAVPAPLARRHLRWDGNTGVIQSPGRQRVPDRSPGDLPRNWPLVSPGHMPGRAILHDPDLNLAVGGGGGGGGGPVQASFTSATMLVDYVRVWLQGVGNIS